MWINGVFDIRNYLFIGIFDIVEFGDVDDLEWYGFDFFTLIFSDDGFFTVEVEDVNIDLFINILILFR